MSNSIKIFRMITGENVIAKLIEENDSMLEIAAPLALIPQSGDGNTMSLGMGPWLLHDDPLNAKVQILQQHVLLMHEPPKAAMDQYCQMTGTVQVVTPNIITK